MKIQVLVATMNQKDHSLLEKMNIQTDVIVGNQNGINCVEQFKWNGYDIIYVNSDSHGVGINRNNILMRATAEICLFADDDVVYVDGYEKIIRKFYQKYPDADVVIFNMLESRGRKSKQIVKKDKKLSRFEIGKYGTYCISIKNQSIISNNIYFHREFGGGTKYCCGEDTIFLWTCAKLGLNIYSSHDLIGIVNHGPSTWFHGYDDKYFRDQGALYKQLFPVIWKPVVAMQIIRHRNLYKNYGIIKAIKKAWD